jgi:hypothetical protein
MLPPAPARLSTTICCPSACASPFAMIRDTVSGLLPAELATTMRIGLAG